MPVYLTSSGKKILMEELKKLHGSLEELTAEKNDAYHNSGDTWHDNPTFNELEQKEGRMMLKIREKQKLLYDAVIIDTEQRNIERVAIGSIAVVEKHTKQENSYSTFTETWEIVGFSESDPDHNKVAYNTPLGKILMNMKQGEVKRTKDPMGEIVEYRVLRLLADWEK
jgi:transcription elongation factor GreA